MLPFVPLCRDWRYPLSVCLGVRVLATGLLGGDAVVVCPLPLLDALFDFRVTLGDLGHGREAALHFLLAVGSRLWAAFRAARARGGGDLLHLRIPRHGFDSLALRVG